MQMNQVKPEHSTSTLSLSDSKIKQNYVPFISKCPRFNSNSNQKRQQLYSKLLKQKFHQKVNIKNANRSIHKDKASKKYQQYIFKNSKGRFEYQSTTDTPSPGSYELRLEKRLKTLQSPHSKAKYDNPSLRQSTLPTIPDKRNKFGINPGDISYVDKSHHQLQRQKQLMKKYRQSLSQDKHDEHSQLKKYHQFQKQLEKKIKAQVTGQYRSERQKQNRNSINKAQSQGQLKVNHLYEYRPIKEKVRLVPISSENKNDNKKKMTKFQFFNSSQKRFKEYAAELDSSRHKNTVRQYLNHIPAQQNK